MVDRHVDAFVQQITLYLFQEIVIARFLKIRLDHLLSISLRICTLKLKLRCRPQPKNFDRARIQLKEVFLIKLEFGFKRFFALIKYAHGFVS